MRHLLAVLIILVCVDSQMANALTCAEISKKWETLILEAHNASVHANEYAMSDSETCQFNREQMIPLAKKFVALMKQVTPGCHEVSIEYSEEQAQEALRNLEKETVERCAAAGL